MVAFQFFCIYCQPNCGFGYSIFELIALTLILKVKAAIFV